MLSVMEVDDVQADTEVVQGRDVSESLTSEAVRAFKLCVAEWGTLKGMATAAYRLGGDAAVVELAGEALALGNEHGELLARRLVAKRAGKALPAEPSSGLEAPRGGDGLTVRERLEAALVEAVESGSKLRVSEAKRAIRRHDANVARAREARETERELSAPLVHGREEAVTLADCVDAARGALPDGVDWQAVQLWPSDYDPDDGREVDWQAVKEAALERDGCVIPWWGPDPRELALEAARVVVRMEGLRGVWPWWSAFKVAPEGERLGRFWALSRGAFDARLRLGARRDGGKRATFWFREDPSDSVLRAGLKLLGRVLFELVGYERPDAERSAWHAAMREERATVRALDAASHRVDLQRAAASAQAARRAERDALAPAERERLDALKRRKLERAEARELWQRARHLACRAALSALNPAERASLVPAGKRRAVRVARLDGLPLGPVRRVLGSGGVEVKAPLVGLHVISVCKSSVCRSA
jgi:hypothetical protein